MAGAYDTAASLLECARAKIETTTAGRVDRVCVVPGAALAWDDCECGQLTVHILRQYPSKVFPAPDQSPMTNCQTAYLVVEYAVTILRCVPTGDDQNPPSCAELDPAAQIQIEDARAVWDGVICCLNDDDLEFTITNQAYVGPEGACAGSSLQIAVGFLS